ncbi:phosphomannomutase/phosphoglucomutase [Natronoglycomyces albus]|uniref:Phosphomannomutase/phosphoglucomutase n=1 Tax=Natronoglycomyces albus TaxID=2811108 RepID=A0A895XW96_9ACTN|nr:phosphomannomutase/phosphoglucomutase [Natronoglycomyces albus]QSB05898.1 phosphomannomutase/phosphoglucomutase [Natronoglycomyces albus]
MVDEQLQAIVKAYDIRGTVPEQLNERIASAIGTAAVEVTGVRTWVVGHDMRDSGPGLAEAFTQAATKAGADVIAAGLCSTDMMYFISGKHNVAGVMLTASHNPAQYNGMKLCLPEAKPISLDTGLARIRDRAAEILADPDSRDNSNTAQGTVTQRDFLADYAAHLRGLVDLSGIRPLKVAVDAGNGMAGHTVPAVLGDQLLEGLPLEIVPLYFELDGTFPNHEANPLEPANLVDLQAKVREVGADIGLAFDGDADRVFVVDAAGDPVSPSAITCMVAEAELAKSPGATVIYNLICSQAVPEVVTEQGGKPHRTRVGHSYIKAAMADHDAIFGGEHSAHYYFRDFWFADTGMLAAMHVLRKLGNCETSLADLVADYDRYPSSGEINSTVEDQAGKIADIKAIYGTKCDVTLEELDGLTITFKDGSWANLRASNTEPLLRLNVEGATEASMIRLRDDILSIVRS